jgi:hypothetical protein
MLSDLQEGSVKPIVFAMVVLSLAPLSAAQQNAAQEFTDPMALLQAVAKNYASAAGHRDFVENEQTPIWHCVLPVPMESLNLRFK